MQTKFTRRQLLSSIPAAMLGLFGWRPKAEPEPSVAGTAPPAGSEPPPVAGLYGPYPLVTTYQYDSSGRLTRIQDPGTCHVTMSYSWAPSQEDAPQGGQEPRDAFAGLRE